MPNAYWIKSAANNTGVITSAFDSALADTVNLNDNSAGDNTTWDPSSAPTTKYSIVTAIWDLGSSQTISRVRFRVGHIGPGVFTLNGSNDGTTWSSTLSGQIPSGSHGTFAWVSEYNYTSASNPSLTGTAYRYWRLAASGVEEDSGGGSFTGDARIGDFRLYDSADDEYVVGPIQRRRYQPVLHHT
jgi:hypothetical protein